MGLSNSKSDNDFDIFYKQAEGFTPPGLKYIQEVTICDKPVVVEFNFINFHKLVNAAKTAFSQEHQGYPTTFYRSASETESFLPENILPRWERSEYLFTKFHTFIMGDNYWYAASSRLCPERRSIIPPTTFLWGRKRWRSSMAWIQSRWRSQSGWGSERHIRFRDTCLDGSGR